MIQSRTSNDRLTVLTGVFEMALVCSTLPLWTGRNPFPAVPLVSGLSTLPLSIDSILLLLLLAGCAALVVSAVRKRCAGVLCVGLLLVGLSLAVLNQHRLQPWHWLFLIIIGQQLFPVADRARLNRLTLASIYVFAAVSRLGPDVADGMTLSVLTVAAEFLPLDQLLRQPMFVFVACVAMNVAECLIGWLLLLRRTRRIGVVLAVALHGALLILLGPWGLNHHTGVLLWNLYFMIAIPVVFWSSSRQINSETAAPTPEANTTLPSWPACLLAGIIALFPASGLIGIADNWLSWQLYSPRPEVLRFYVRGDAVDLLPESLQDYVASPAPLQNWCPVSLNQWSFATTHAPIYPEDRLQLAVVSQLTARLADGQWRAELHRPGFPGWWLREVTEIQAREDLEELQTRFLLNAAACRRR